MQDKLLLFVAPCVPPEMASLIPGLDVSPEGVAKEVLRAHEAGANCVHLHVLDERGRPTTDLTAFRHTLRLIREACDIVVEGSTGGMSGLSATERAVSLHADIDVATLNCGSVNFGSGVYINSPDDIRQWAREMHGRGIKPNVSVFETGMIANSMHFAEEGWIAPPYLFTFALGHRGAMPATPRNLLFLSESIPCGSQWCAVGHGGHDLRMAGLAILMGGHARAGFEDNPYYEVGRVATSNAQLIERLVRIAREMGREIASPGEARSMLNLAQRSPREVEPD